MKNDEAYLMILGSVVKPKVADPPDPTYVTIYIGDTQYRVYDSYYSDLSGVSEKEIGVVIDDDDANSIYVVISEGDETNSSIIGHSNAKSSDETPPRQFLVLPDDTDGIRAYRSKEVVSGEQKQLDSQFVVNPIGMDVQAIAQDNVTVAYSDGSTGTFDYESTMILDSQVWLPVPSGKTITSIKIGETSYQWHMSVKLSFSSEDASSGCYVTFTDGSIQMIKSGDIKEFRDEWDEYVYERVAIVDSDHLASYYQIILLSEDTEQLPSDRIRTIVRVENVTGEVKSYDHPFDRKEPWRDRVYGNSSAWYSSINISVPYYSCDDDGSVHEYSQESEECARWRTGATRYYYKSNRYLNEIPYTEHGFRGFCIPGTKTIKYKYTGIVDDLHYNPQIIGHTYQRHGNESASQVLQNNTTWEYLRNWNHSAAELLLPSSSTQIFFSGTFIDGNYLYVAMHCGEFAWSSCGYGGQNAKFNVTDGPTTCGFSGITQYSWAIETTICKGLFDSTKVSPIPTIIKRYVIISRNYPFGDWNETQVSYRTITDRNCVYVETRTRDSSGKIGEGNVGIQQCGPTWFCNQPPMPEPDGPEFSATCPEEGAKCISTYVLYYEETACASTACGAIPPLNYSRHWHLADISDLALQPDFDEDEYRKELEFEIPNHYEISNATLSCYNCLGNEYERKTQYSLNPTASPARRVVEQFIRVPDDESEMIEDLFDSLQDTYCIGGWRGCTCTVPATSFIDPQPIAISIGVTNSENRTISLPQSVPKEFVGWNWSLTETGHNLTYSSGAVDLDGNLSGIGSTFRSNYNYNGYMSIILTPPVCP